MTIAPAELVKQLSSVELERRLAELSAEQAAVRTLLRAARAKEIREPKREQTEASINA